MTDSLLKRNVMRRVRTIHAIRPFVNAMTLAALVASAALYGIGREVWVAKVLENSPTDIVSATLFLASPFSETELIVQALSVLVLVSVVYLARETAKLITASLV